MCNILTDLNTYLDLYVNFDFDKDTALDAHVYASQVCTCQIFLHWRKMLQRRHAPQSATASLNARLRSGRLSELWLYRDAMPAEIGRCVATTKRRDVIPATSWLGLSQLPAPPGSALVLFFARPSGWKAFSSKA